MDFLNKIEFKPYAKTPRLFGGKNIIVSEKIDGSNAAVQIIPVNQLDQVQDENGKFEHLFDDDIAKITAMVFDNSLAVVAQSRNRIITPESDNFGFAAWVAKNAEGLVEALGTGIHRGEWWGSGIQRGYGLTKGEKRFSLFAIDRYKESPLENVPGLAVVPELYRGEFDTMIIKSKLRLLDVLGSKAVPGYDNPEGLIIYHEASREVFKYTFDDTPKGNQE